MVAKTATTKEVSKGICHFCKGEFAKSKMSQHLKFCKARQAALKAQAEQAGAGKSETLYHILVEGDRYLSNYWMHLELPASATFYDLDVFLRGIWLECCGHLSGFKIGRDLYSSESGEYMVWGDEIDAQLGDTEEAEHTQQDTAEGEEDLLVEIEEEEEEEFPSFEQYLSEVIGSVYIKANVDIAALPPDLETMFRKQYDYARTRWENMPREHSIDVAVGKVFKPGVKGEYTYDYGSSTELNLRVVGEREAKVSEEDETIRVLARNLAPVFPCSSCGKPATQIAAGYFYARSAAYCMECAKENAAYGENSLPIVNSPRCGICAYTGDATFDAEEGVWSVEDKEA